MSKLKDLTGQIFGCLTVIERAEKSGISYSALCHRYYRDGKRGEELFAPVKLCTKQED